MNQVEEKNKQKVQYEKYLLIRRCNIKDYFARILSQTNLIRIVCGTNRFNFQTEANERLIIVVFKQKQLNA